MVGICGLEPQTSSLSVTRSNQLSYIPRLSLFYPIIPKKSTLRLPEKQKISYNMLMEWNFSIGWMITGLLITAVSGAIVANYQKISDNMLSGPSSYQSVKFWGLIGVGISFLISALVQNPLNKLIKHFTSLVDIIDIPFTSFKGHVFLFQLLIIVGALFVCLLATYLPIAFSKRISLKEELQSND